MRSVRAARIAAVMVPASFAAGTAALMLMFPGESLKAALTGISIWWEVLFPSLFPFFVVSELMLGFGIVHFFGTLLDPMMRPVFRLPGSGGFVMAMGFASGYPVGARLTAQLWDSKLLNRDESQRLVAFTTTADPIFLIGAVSVGFFRDASLAPILALAHYGSAALLGVLLSFRARRAAASSSAGASAGTASSGLISRAFRAMHAARIADGRSFGRLLLDGIGAGVRLIIVVGTLVVFFSVVIEVFTMARLIPLLTSAVAAVLSLLFIPAPLSAALVSGLFEVTLGARAAGVSAPGVPLQAQAAVASFGLAWAGLSVHAQIMSIISHMPVKYFGYAAAKFVQGILAAIIVCFAWPWLGPSGEAAPAWLPLSGGAPDWQAAGSSLALPLAVFAAALLFIPLGYGVSLLIRFALRLLKSLVR